MSSLDGVSATKARGHCMLKLSVKDFRPSTLDRLDRFFALLSEYSPLPWSGGVCSLQPMSMPPERIEEVAVGAFDRVFQNRFHFQRSDPC